MPKAGVGAVLRALASGAFGRVAGAPWDRAGLEVVEIGEASRGEGVLAHEAEGPLDAFTWGEAIPGCELEQREVVGGSLHGCSPFCAQRCAVILGRPVPSWRWRAMSGASSIVGR